MELEQILAVLIEKHKRNLNFKFRMTHGKIEVKSDKEPKNVIIVDKLGNVNSSRWYTGSNNNGMWIPPSLRNHPSLKNVEHIIDRLLTIPGSKNREGWIF